MLIGKHNKSSTIKGRTSNSVQEDLPWKWGGIIGWFSFPHEALETKEKVYHVYTHKYKHKIYKQHQVH